MTAAAAPSPRAHSFNAAAAQYAAHRPSYPPALFDAVENLAGRPLAGARVLDVGAGTGIATALLAARGAHVVAVEPGDGMGREFRRGLPDVPLVRADGDHLPFADGSADFITYAQAWHWTDQERSVPEAIRVLRPGGALALWWNSADHTVPWLAAQGARIARCLGYDDEARHTADRTSELTKALDFRRDRVRWSRRIPLDSHLANVGSHSAFLVLGQDSTAAFLAEEREELLKTFPDGMVEESYNVDLLLATVIAPAMPPFVAPENGGHDLTPPASGAP